jgi:signal recognition particle subunit SRP54
MASRILQMGDILEVAREAHRLVDEKERLDLEERMRKGQFGLTEFRSIMEKFRKPGLMQKMLGLMPGMGEINKLMSGADSEKEMRRVSGIIDSMTPAERSNPKLIDNQRRMRIAAGAGVAASQVNDLVKQFDMLAPLMQMAAGGNMRDRMSMMQQMQQMMAANPMNPMMGMKVKQGTGKRLTPKEREKLLKEREKALRKAKRKDK